MARLLLISSLLLSTLIQAAPQSLDSSGTLSTFFSAPSETTTYPVIITLQEDAPKDEVSSRIVEMMDTSTADNEYKADLDTVLNGITGSFSADILHTIEQEFPDALKVIEPDQIMRVNQFSNIYGIKKQQPVGNWGQARIVQGKLNVTLPYLYPEAGGQGVDIYVLDSGIYPNHPDFDPNLVTMEKNYVLNEPPVDFSGHGTWVAGQIAGQMFGMAKKARVRAIKVLNRFGAGVASDILLAIEYATRQHMVTPNARSILSMSIGGPISIAVNSAIGAANAAGILVIVAAGNMGTDACRTSPASASGAYVVGATDNLDGMTPWSNYGACVDLYAPGLDLRGAWIPVAPLGSNPPATWFEFPAVYMSGTSMAAPFVTGIAAMIMSTMPIVDHRYVRSQLTAMSQKKVVKNIPTGTGSRNRLANMRAMLSSYWAFKMRWLSWIRGSAHKITSWDALMAKVATVNPFKKGAMQYAIAMNLTTAATASALSFDEEESAVEDHNAFLASPDSQVSTATTSTTVTAPVEITNSVYAMNWQEFTDAEDTNTATSTPVNLNDPLFNAAAIGIVTI